MRLRRLAFKTSGCGARAGHRTDDRLGAPDRALHLLRSTLRQPAQIAGEHVGHLAERAHLLGRLHHLDQSPG